MAPQTDAMRLIARARGILDDVLDDDRLGRGVHASHIERALQEQRRGADMPYIITYGSDKVMAETIGETRAIVTDIVGEHTTPPRDGSQDEWDAALQALNATGDTIGPLPGGLVITVRRIA